MQQLSLRTVQQSLAPRGLRVSRTSPYPDGRCRFTLRRNIGGPSFFSDDPEELYIKGLRLAAADDAANCVGSLRHARTH